jgi:hypothetical protein
MEYFNRDRLSISGQIARNRNWTSPSNEKGGRSVKKTNRGDQGVGIAFETPWLMKEGPADLILKRSLSEVRQEMTRS